MRSRVLTAFGLIPFVLGAFFCVSPLPVLTLGCIASLISTFELSALLKRGSVWIGLVLWVSLAAYLISRPFATLILLASVALIGSTVGVVATYFCKKTPSPVIPSVFAPFWYLVPLSSLIMLHQLPVLHGTWDFKNPILLAVLPLWGGDTAGIFVGKAFGKHLLAPTISPKKTIEGAVGNLLVCIAVAMPLGLWLGYYWRDVLLCGVTAGVMGQFGDLFESAVKRYANVKDSGSLLPGHGGLLDRIDSLLFTAPIVYAILAISSAH